MKQKNYHQKYPTLTIGKFALKLYYMPKIKLINIHVDSQYSLKAGGEGGLSVVSGGFTRSHLVGNYISELATLEFFSFRILHLANGFDLIMKFSILFH